MSAKTHQPEHKVTSNPDVVSIRDFYGHDIRIALLEKTAADIHNILIEMKSEARADTRELRGYIIGVYAIMGAAALGRIFGLI